MMYRWKKIALMSLICCWMMNSFQASATLTYTIDPPEQGMFGKSTSVEVSTEIPVRQSMNIDRSKNSAFVPPDFASTSADTRGTGYLLTPNISGVAQMQIGSTGELVENTTPYSAVGNQVNAANSLPPSITQTAPQADVSITHTGFTPVGSVKQSDDSIGRLKIPSLDVNIKVYDGESLSNMKKAQGIFHQLLAGMAMLRLQPIIVEQTAILEKFINFVLEIRLSMRQNLEYAPMQCTLSGW